jgi:hypothetical protein
MPHVQLRHRLLRRRRPGRRSPHPRRPASQRRRTRRHRRRRRRQRRSPLRMTSLYRVATRDQPLRVGVAERPPEERREPEPEDGADVAVARAADALYFPSGITAPADYGLTIYVAGYQYGTAGASSDRGLVSLGGSGNASSRTSAVWSSMTGRGALDRGTGCCVNDAHRASLMQRTCRKFRRPAQSMAVTLERDVLGHIHKFQNVAADLPTAPGSNSVGICVQSREDRCIFLLDGNSFNLSSPCLVEPWPRWCADPSCRSRGASRVCSTEW